MAKFNTNLGTVEVIVVPTSATYNVTTVVTVKGVEFIVTTECDLLDYDFEGFLACRSTQRQTLYFRPTWFVYDG